VTRAVASERETPRASEPPGARRAQASVRAAWALGLAALVTYVLTGGGRIVGSDEVTMLQLSRAILHGRIDVPAGATMRGPDGRFYSKNAAGQAVLTLPIVAVADAAAHALRFGPERADLAARCVASFWNGLVTAVLLAMLYLSLRRLRVGARSALAATVLLGFTTPLWIYAKSFMAEPVEALGLLLAVTGGAQAGAAPSPPDARRGAWLAALGAFLAISVKLGTAPLALASLTSLGLSRPRAWVVPAIGVAAALAGHAIYDVLRFHDPLQSGYGAQASPLAFTTPVWVGVYGLLLSSGKGLAWFAPAAWLAPAGIAAMVQSRQHSDAARGTPPQDGSGDAARRAGWAILVTAAVALFVYGRFQHWGGDGSWGPRYLVPLLPLLALALGFTLEGASRARRRLAWVLGMAGFVVTLGGVGIYFGAEMREVGDYPYKLPLEDPHFLEASHWNPRFTPIVQHWRMLVRNTGEHLRGEAPIFGGERGAVDPRTSLAPGEEHALLHALDFWWLYAGYAGLPRVPLELVAIALLALTGWLWWRVLAIVRTDAGTA